METYGIYKRIFDAQGTNTTQVLDAKDFSIAIVSVTGNSTPDGTVNVYTIPSAVEYTTNKVNVIAYATPTTTKQFIGFPNGALLFELTGNTTGNVDVEVVLK